MILAFFSSLFGLPVAAEAPCSGEVDSAAAQAAGLNEWLPEFEPGCRGSH
jgi:hypothetical protein